MGAVWRNGLTAGDSALDMGKTIVDYIEQFMNRIKNAACGSSIVVALTLPRIRWGAGFWLAGYMLACTRGQELILGLLRGVHNFYEKHRRAVSCGLFFGGLVGGVATLPVHAYELKRAWALRELSRRNFRYGSGLGIASGVSFALWQASGGEACL